MLPEPFRDLEPWTSWCLATEGERSAKRRGSRMEELEAFYSAMLARLGAILDYLEDFAPETATPEVERLSQLTLSLAEIAPAIECFGEPTVSYGFDVSRFIPGPE